MKNSINSQEYSDIKFILTDDTVIHSHRSILSIRSEYFQTLFSSQFLDGIADSINIKEVDSITFISLLRYMYTNDIELEHDKIVDTIIGASRFLLEEMKQRLEILLESDITEENVVDMLLFSDGADTHKLKKSCISYVVEKFELLKKTKQIDELRDNIHLYKHIEFLHSKKSTKWEENNIEKMISF